MVLIILINFLTAIDLTGTEFIIDQKRSKIKKAISVRIKCKTSFFVLLIQRLYRKTYASVKTENLAFCSALK